MWWSPVLLSCVVACASVEPLRSAESGDGGGCAAPLSGPEVAAIHEIQGGGQTSSYVGLEVVFCGVVAARWEGGVFVESSEDRRAADRGSSEGIRVELRGAPVAVGLSVRVIGRVEERAADPADRSETVVSEATVEILGPAEIPRAADAFDRFGDLPSLLDWIDRYERLEGMRVGLQRPVVVQGAFDGASLALIDGRLVDDDDRTAAGGVISHSGLRPEIFLVDAPALPGSVEVGDVMDGAVEGVVTYRDGRYRLLATASLPSVVSAYRPPERVRRPAPDQLSVATLNVEWLGQDDRPRVERLGRSIVTRLGAPDIVVLQEVVAQGAAQTLQLLRDAVSHHGGPPYEIWFDEASDGALRLTLLTRSDRAILTRTEPDRDPQGVRFDVGAGGLVPNPGSIEPDSPAFSGSRVPLAAHVCVAGRSVVVIGVHLSSRRADDPLMGLEQPPRTPSATRRMAQARRVVEFAASAVGEGASVIVGGDFNDTPGSPIFDVFGAAGFQNPAEHQPPARRYSYVYQGTSQLLDHLLVDEAHAEEAAVEIVHGQADRAEAERDTDHDALVLTLPLATLGACPEPARARP